jgi:hypothetical protein
MTAPESGAPPACRVADLKRQTVNVLTFVTVLIANGMAGAGAISGESIGVIANRYRSYFLPADYVFAIWSLIYLLLLVFTVYQALPGNRGRSVLRRVGWWWGINGLLNIAWVTTFSFGLFGPSLIIMLGLLGTLITIHGRVGLDEHLTWSERVSVSYPFGLYLSWICIAVIANTFQFISYMEWTWLGIDQPVWSAIMAVVATGVSIAVVWKRGLWIFPLVVAWALAGIAVRFSEIPVIAITGWAMVVLALVPIPVALRLRWVRRASSVAMAIILLSGAASGAAAQTAVLRGLVVDNADRRPLQGAMVTVVGGGAQTLTDGAGRFVIRGLAPGLASVEVTVIGYRAALEAEIVLQTSRPTYVEFRLERQAIELEGLLVGAPAFRVPDPAPTSLTVLSNEELRRTPGGFMDVSRTLLSLPGVLGGVDNRNDLLVRGGGPGENSYYLDGFRIPQINHFATQGASGGALGLVNTDFIRETEFFTGAFPAEYGDALSSVLSIENRPGSPDGVQGDFTLGATEVALTLDGPAGKNANWLFSVRRSYLQFLFKALGLPIRPDYWDAQFRFEAQPTLQDRILIAGIGALDNFDIIPPGADADFEDFEIAQRVIDNDQRSATVGMSWRRLIPGGYITSSVSRSVSDFSFADLGSDGGVVLENESLEKDTRLAVQGNFASGDAFTVALGVEADRASIDARLFQRAVPGGTLPADLAWEEALGLWKLGSYARITGRPAARVSLTAGLRADEVTALDAGLELSPRVSGRIELGGGFSGQLAAGVFHQAPNLLSLSVREGGADVNTGLRQQRTRQLVGGFSWIARPGLRLSLEGFLKEYDRVPVLRDDPRIALPNLGGDYGFVGAEPLVDSGVGRAKGLELFAQQKLLGSVYVLGAYTLAWSEFGGPDGILSPSSWDRRHALDLTAGYRSGGSWEFGAKLRALSGLATTPWDLEASEAAYALTGRGVPDWDQVGAIRTPAYARLDIRAERWLSYANWNAVLYLDIQNVLNRENAVGFQYTENPAYPDRIQPVEGSGLLPTFGFSIEF